MSDRYAQLIAAAASENDPARAKATYGQLNDLLLDESFVFTMTVSPPTILAKTTVQGIAWTAHESPWYATTWIG